MGLRLCWHVDEPHLLLLGQAFGRQDFRVARLKQVNSVLLHIHGDVLQIYLVLNLLLSAQKTLTTQKQAFIHNPAFQIFLLLSLGQRQGSLCL